MRRKKADPECCSTLEEVSDKIRQLVSESQNENIRELNLSIDDSKKREKQKGYLRKALRQCCMGDAGSREYVKEYIKGLLESRLNINEQSIFNIFKLYAPDKLTTQDKFEYLAREFMHSGTELFSRLCEKYEWAKMFENGCCTLSNEAVDSAYESERLSVAYPDVLDMLAQRVYQNLYGYSAADILIFDDSLDGISGGTGGVTRISYDYRNELSGRDDIGSNCYDTIYIMYRGRTIRLPFLSFGSEKTLERVVRSICRYDADRALSRNNPMVVCSLMDNSRVVVARPPVSDSWVFYVRRFRSSRVEDIKELISDIGNDKAIFILKSIVESEQNLIITGNQGGGKTTLLKALVRFINPAYTLRIAESVFELNLNNLYPERNVQSIQEWGHFTLYEALTVYKKTDTDIIILGEINEPRVAGALVQIVQNGGRMAISTAHHNTSQGLVEYLRNALISEYSINDVHVAEEQAVKTVNFDVHMIRDQNGHHLIERITEIIPTGLSGQNKTFNCRDILTFNKERKEYIITGMVSEAAIGRIKRNKGEQYSIVFKEQMGRYIERRNRYI